MDGGDNIATQFRFQGNSTLKISKDGLLLLNKNGDSSRVSFKEHDISFKKPNYFDYRINIERVKGGKLQNKRSPKKAKPKETTQDSRRGQIYENYTIKKPDKTPTGALQWQTNEKIKSTAKSGRLKDDKPLFSSSDSANPRLHEHDSPLIYTHEKSAQNEKLKPTDNNGRLKDDKPVFSSSEPATTRLHEQDSPLIHTREKSARFEQEQTGNAFNRSGPDDKGYYHYSYKKAENGSTGAHNELGGRNDKLDHTKPNSKNNNQGFSPDGTPEKKGWYDRRYEKKHNKYQSRIEEAELGITRRGLKFSPHFELDGTQWRLKWKVQTQAQKKFLSKKKVLRRRTGDNTRLQFHQTVNQLNTDENTGVEATNKIWNSGEKFLRKSWREIGAARRRHYNKPWRMLDKYTQKITSLDSKHTRHEIQKKFIKKLYKKMQTAKHAVEDNARKFAVQGARYLAKVIFANKTLLAGVLGILAITSFLSVGMTSCMQLMFNTTAMIMSTYPAEDPHISDSDLYVTQQEMELKEKIDTIEEQPEWSHIDEFDIKADTSEITHNPFEYAAYLAVMFEDYQFGTEIISELNSIHNARYDLKIEEEIEIRYDDNDNEYEYFILHVTLTAEPFLGIAEQRMGASTEGAVKLEWFGDLMESGGGHQTYANPSDVDWRGMVTSPFGYRILDNVANGEPHLHGGMDIGYSEGTPVRAAISGVVTSVVYGNYDFGDYVVMQDMDNFSQVKYAHNSAIYVSPGDIVVAGETIVSAVGATGNVTGPHLHIEIKENGQLLNPFNLISFMPRI